MIGRTACNHTRTDARSRMLCCESMKQTVRPAEINGSLRAPTLPGMGTKRIDSWEPTLGSWEACVQLDIMIYSFPSKGPGDSATDVAPPRRVYRPRPFPPFPLAVYICMNAAADLLPMKAKKNSMPPVCEAPPYCCL